ncbi:MAG: NIL domain-containing protein [Chloroflexi bacterium]|nr:NIL domain-containing protein [Chloroflexota bacterium]
MATKHVRLTYSQQLIKEPLIYNMGHTFQVVTDVRVADVGPAAGFVIMEISGEDDEIERALQWARDKGVRVDDATLGDVVEG